MGKKILGLDLGVTSIGWAVIHEENNKTKILGLGSRIIPLSVDDSNEFSTGNAISKNAKRTLKRTQRKGYDRYQFRRNKLLLFFQTHHLQPSDQLMNLPPLELWSLRARSVVEKISLQELGRVLYHLNQKRGYKSSRNEENSGERKDTEFAAEVKGRYESLKQTGKTIGQLFYQALFVAHQNCQPYRIKQQVFPRQAYIEEFDTILLEQKKHYSFLTDALISELRDEIIYYQRPLKSKKGLVSICEFEGQYRNDKKGDKVFTGPKVCPRSSPLAELVKIWETVNNLSLTNKRGEVYSLSLVQKKKLADYLNQNERMSQARLFELLGLKTSEGWTGNKQTAKGVQGNITYCALSSILEDQKDLLRFDLTTNTLNEEVFVIDTKTGEVKGSSMKKMVDKDFEKQPLFQLWHTIYSISDLDECAAALQNKFNLDKTKAIKLAKLDFTKAGFSNKSTSAIRKMLPYLMEGFVYSEAMSLAGYNHSASLTKEENFKRQLLQQLPLLKKNSLRQPIVEKILNQMIGLVNEVITKWGHPDEIRVELARELKQSKEERNDTYIALNKREKENNIIRKRIETEYGTYGVRATRNTLIKWRLFHEINNDEVKTNAICIYCGQSFGITDALRGSSVDVEHIIPKSKLFDDSQSNKTLVHRACNESKDDNTAYDFMAAKGEKELSKYVDRVEAMYKAKIIGKRKRDNLLKTEKDIPKDFIERQLRETQYISRKAKEILEQVCYNVWSTSGSVTEYLRRVWGWDKVLMNLRLPEFRAIGMVEYIQKENTAGQDYQEEIIKGWSKRDDHRHHAIDALTVAFTQQGFIQRINTISATKTREQIRKELNTGYDLRKNLLENYIFSKKPLNTAEVEMAVSKVLVSFKSGKKVASVSKYKALGKNIKTGVIVPRGPLSEESVYGLIQTIEKQKPLKFLFENPDLIFKPYIRELVETRLNSFQGDSKKALASLKKEPIYLDKERNVLLKYATCYRSEYVIKYPIGSIGPKDVQYIVDPHIRKLVFNRFEQYKGAEKKAFELPIYSDERQTIQVRSVRCFTGLSAVEPIKTNESGKNIGFVKPGNNHHMAIYRDSEGNLHEHICSFWHAVERKKYGLPVIMENAADIWENILNNPEVYSQSFLLKLPDQNWRLIQSIQQNEMFLIGLPIPQAGQAVEEKNYPLLSKHLYRVQKIGSTGYKLVLRHHLATTIDRDNEMKGYASPAKFDGIKVRIDKTGDISMITAGSKPISRAHEIV